MIKIFAKTLIILLIGLMGTIKDVVAFPLIRPKNNISLSLFGDASIFSMNYERLFSNDRKFFLAGKLGIGYSESMRLPSGNTSLLSTPMHITGNVNIFEKRHFIEFGFGGTLLFYENLKYWDYSIYPLVGYRLQPLKSGRVIFRIFISYPLTNKIDFNDYWFFPVGLSIGYCF
jgi:hypothetical protein